MLNNFKHIPSAELVLALFDFQQISVVVLVAVAVVVVAVAAVVDRQFAAVAEEIFHVLLVVVAVLALVALFLTVQVVAHVVAAVVADKVDMLAAVVVAAVALQLLILQVSVAVQQGFDTAAVVVLQPLVFRLSKSVAAAVVVVVRGCSDELIERLVSVAGLLEAADAPAFVVVAAAVVVVVLFADLLVVVSQQKDLLSLHLCCQVCDSL